MSRRKRIQIGWHCDHHDEATRENDYKTSHISSHGKLKRGKWIESYPQPYVLASFHHLDYKDPKKRPACARAVPVYIYKEQP